MTLIYAPEQMLVWYKTKKGGVQTTGKFRAKFICNSGKTKARIKILSSGETKLVGLDSIISISDFKGRESDLE